MRLADSFKILLGIVAVIVVPAAIALNTVAYPGVWSVSSSNPTPYGYTYSLLIYLAPSAMMLVWLRRYGPTDYRKRAVKWTLGILIFIGVFLDVFLGNTIFEFPNRGATFGLYLPGYSFDTGTFSLSIPIEEFAFYITGFVAILLVYVWCDEHWVAAYNKLPYENCDTNVPYLLQCDLRSFGFGFGTIAVAVLYKWYGPHDVQHGWPIYFIFLTVVAIVPALAGLKTAMPYINWRAFSFTFLWVLLTSLMWEVTLALPYGWWNYQHAHMAGVFVGAWHNLPIEAVLVWLVVTFTTVVVFEVTKVALNLLAAGRSVRVALIGSETLGNWARSQVWDRSPPQEQDAGRSSPVSLCCGNGLTKGPRRG